MSQKESEWKKEFVEKGAALEHERWAKWQAYMHSKFVEHSDGKGEFVCLPVEFYKRWERQIATVYSELTEPEKESDREQVRPYIPFVQEAISNREKEIAEEVEEEVNLEQLKRYKDEDSKLAHNSYGAGHSFGSWEMADKILSILKH